MKLAFGTTFLIFLVFAGFSKAQTNGNSSLTNTELPAPAAEPSVESYVVFNATAAQEAALRAQIRLINPPVLPLRIFFVPHWKYLDAAKTFRLRVPTGFASVMFTHLPSRTVFIDNDRYLSEDWLGHWIAHELGHLATNSVDEHDADRAAREFRRPLKDLRYKRGNVPRTRGVVLLPVTPCCTILVQWI